MPLLLLSSVILFTAAMVLYTLGVWAERRARRLKPWHVWVFFSGVLVDTLATILTYIYVGGIVLTPHAIMGFISLSLMAAHFIWAATLIVGKGNEAALTSFHKLSLFVWSIWMASYLSGFALGIMKIA